MNQLSALFAKLETTLGIQAPYLTIALKVTLTIVGFLLAWLILRQVLKFIEKRMKKINLIEIQEQLFKIFRKALFYALVLVAGSYIIGLLNIALLEKIFHALFVILFAGPSKNFLIVTIRYLQSRVAHKTDSKIDDIVFDLLIRFADFIIYAVAIIIALDILGINVMPFIAGAGIVGLAIGFAAKDTLSNLISGILLIIDRPFEVNDRIEVWSAPAGSATWGDVIDIGLRATKIKTTDNIVIIIPNNEIMRRDIINYTIISEKIRVRINIGIAYDADLQKTKNVILQVAQTTEGVADDPPPKVVVRNFGESSVDLQLRVWIHDARKRMDTISYITDKVKEAFDREGIEIPYPKRDIFITQKSS
ncbi:MAG: mechanosensitive ion channel family protein [Desulfobacterales bacterium]|jgi:small-conductance mechanosensitive channel|nr:mechanosensitive ion channel family protein [Desulfobacterales bacterium]